MWKNCVLWQYLSSINQYFGTNKNLLYLTRNLSVMKRMKYSMRAGILDRQHHRRPYSAMFITDSSMAGTS